VIPHSSYLHLKNEKADIVINSINEKLNSYDKKKKGIQIKFQTHSLLQKTVFFKFIKDHLLKSDQVKNDQFKLINFTYDL